MTTAGAEPHGRWLVGAAAIALCVQLALAWRFDFLVDDAYISFRYARHLAEGAGLRFNTGESPPVEGYSNFLWTLVLGGLHYAGLAPTVAARLLSVACGAGLVLHVAAFLRREFALGARELLASALFLATFPALAVWSTSGLETVPAAWALFATFAAILGSRARPRWGLAAVSGALLALLRVDGAILLALLAAVVLAVARDRTQRRALVRAAAVWLAVIAAHELGRIAYHGDAIPNCVLVKGGFSPVRLERGVRYVASFLLAALSLPAVLLASAFVLRGPHSALARSSLALVGGVLAYAIAVGGDFMAMGRWLVAGVPFVALLFALVLRRLAARGLAAAAWTLGCPLLSLLPSFDLHPVPQSVRERLDFRRDGPFLSERGKWEQMKVRGEGFAVLGRVLADVTRPGESMILGPLGAVGYHTELFLLDVYGLVSREVAALDLEPTRAPAGHDRSVPIEFFLDRDPTYLPPYLAEPNEESRRLLERWDEHPYARLAELERHRVPEEYGLPVGTEVWLFRVTESARRR